MEVSVLYICRCPVPEGFITELVELNCVSLIDNIVDARVLYLLFVSYYRLESTSFVNNHFNFIGNATQHSKYFNFKPKHTTVLLKKIISDYTLALYYITTLVTVQFMSNHKQCIKERQLRE